MSLVNLPPDQIIRGDKMSEFRKPDKVSQTPGKLWKRQGMLAFYLRMSKQLCKWFLSYFQQYFQGLKVSNVQHSVLKDEHNPTKTLASQMKLQKATRSERQSERRKQSRGGAEQTSVLSRSQMLPGKKLCNWV